MHPRKLISRLVWKTCSASPLFTLRHVRMWTHVAHASSPWQQWHVRQMQPCFHSATQSGTAYVHLTGGWTGWYARVTHCSSPPPPPPWFNRILDLALWAELQEIVAKNLVSRVPQGQDSQGFYSCYFLVPKKTMVKTNPGPVTVQHWPFPMLTIKQGLKCVHQGERFSSVDLKDALFHVPKNSCASHSRVFNFNTIACHLVILWLFSS